MGTMRELITGQSIADARRAGQQEIVVSARALITPQAKDDAKQYGIAIRFCEDKAAEPVAQKPITVPEPITTDRYAMNNNSNNGQAPAWAAPVVQFGAQPAGTACNAAGDAADIAAQVAARLQGLLGANAGAQLQGTVAQVVSEVMHTGATSAHSAGPVSTGIALNGVDVVPFPANNPTASVQGEMNIEEAFLPGDNGPGVTRFSFANASLDWTFANDEVLVVTKGTVQISQGGNAVTLNVGGAARMHKGTSVVLTAQGEVCCIASSFVK